MVFKPFSHLARQSFTKSIAHGYAQSIVAASQSSYAAPFGTFNNHRFNNKNGPLQFRDAFQHNSSTSNANAKVAFSSGNDQSGNGGLDAYYEAWQKHQQHAAEGGEWQQFQFTKRIGWKPSPSGLEAKGKEEEVCVRPEALLSRTGLGKDRSYTANDLDDLKKVAGDAIEAAAVAKVDEAIANEILDIQKSSKAASSTTVTQAVVEDAVDAKASSGPVEQQLESVSLRAESVSPTVSRLSSSTAPTSLDSTTHVDKLCELQDAGHYAEIPPVFEAMLLAGVVPSATAYNALLLAAVHLPASKHQVVPKALDIYSDMLRRKVQPDTVTYTVLLELLSSRALEVAEMKANLEQDRARFGGMKEVGRFMLRSQEAEYDLLAEDDSLSIAIRLFNASTINQKQRTYSAETYRLLLTACSTTGEVDKMIQIYSHMESHKIVPHASIYAPMIKGFAASGDLRSAVECYNEYKILATANDNGKASLIDRTDDEVYAAVIKSYVMCGKQAGADKFYGKIVNSFAETESREVRLDAIRDTVVLQAFVQECLESGRFQDALKTAEQLTMSVEARDQAFERIVVAAADHTDVEAAIQAFNHVSDSRSQSSVAAIAMLAMHIRRGEVESARAIWSVIAAVPNPTSAFIEPAAMYAIALIGTGSVDEGLMQARQAFARVRSSPNASIGQSETTEQIDESIELIGSFLSEKAITPSPEAGMNFMWAMVENGGLVKPVAESLLAVLGPGDIHKLSWQDLKLALQVEAGIVGRDSAVLDVAHSARFSHLLETSLVNQMPLDKRTADLVEMCLAKVGYQRPDLVARWHSYKHPAPQLVAPSPMYAAPPVPAAAPMSYSDNFDPYASTVDHRGSSIIVDGLEKQGTRGNSALNEALLTFKNIRRAGRHPRYIAYAKLIAAAAKDGRANLIHDLHGMAKQDMPLLPQYPVVRHGWVSILDAMVGACLTLGNRRMAADFHRELLDFGAAPTANTFGLYITTLKESTKTFDEATEAVRIFQRAKSEGVEPSSFLYNALIGKLGKARRIDDCLFYFAEMRSRGIRPTSVTYGTIVNALCRVSDERFAQELFDEMESMPNYKPRPAPYNSLMQFFLTTKRDSGKVIEYYQRMQSRNIQPTMHTYKLLIDTYATLEPVNMAAAEGVLDTIRASGQRPEAVHYASLIHAKGCALHEMDGARQIFDDVVSNSGLRPQACLFQALFESMVANHCVKDTKAVLKDMNARGVAMTPYIANTLIHGWALEKNISEAKSVYDTVGKEKREPSTYEAMTRAFLSAELRDNASDVVHEMLSRGYPTAVSGKILELLGHGATRANSVVPSA